MNTDLTTSEREMIIMLLQKEEKSLHIEINHSSHREFKLALKERLQMVMDVIEKMKIPDTQKVF